MRPRRSLSAAASRLSKSPADFLALPGGAGGPENGGLAGEGRAGSATPNGEPAVPSSFVLSSFLSLLPIAFLPVWDGPCCACVGCPAMHRAPFGASRLPLYRLALVLYLSFSWALHLHCRPVAPPPSLLRSLPTHTAHTALLPAAAAAGNVFVPRDNPRRLFIRDPLPSTQGAGATTASPSLRGGTPARDMRTPGEAAGSEEPCCALC